MKLICSCHNQSTTIHPSRSDLLSKVAICTTCTLIACLGRTGADRGARIDECRQSGHGERWRIFFSSLSAGRWPLAWRYEENVTLHYPSLSSRPRWSFFFFLAILQKENNSFSHWLISAICAESKKAVKARLVCFHKFPLSVPLSSVTCLNEGGAGSTVWSSLQQDCPTSCNMEAFHFWVLLVSHILRNISQKHSLNLPFKDASVLGYSGGGGGGGALPSLCLRYILVGIFIYNGEYRLL